MRMTTTTITKSPFDTGNWSEVNGLPGQDDMIHYMEHLLASNPNQCFTRRGLMDSVAKEFNIPTMAQEVEGPQSGTTGFYTRMTYLITDSVQGKRRAEKAFAKRLAFGVYQHISGNGEISPDIKKALTKRAKLSNRDVKDAMTSVQILHRMNWSPEAIILDLHQWSDEVIEEAIRRVCGEDAI